MLYTSYAPARCGIVLAAGEGKRLQRFVYQLRGERLPKQYVNFVGRGSMLDHTFERVERLIPPERLFTVVDRDHLEHPEARRQLVDRPPATVIAQPANRETGPGLLLPLLHVYRRYPQATVAVFPSDHFILEEELFMDHVDRAFNAVDRDPSRIVLLGVTPNQIEPDYGYIVPANQYPSGDVPISGVAGFVEKPEPPAARALIYRGALWNTMVMVFKADTFLNLARLIAPRLHRAFETIGDAIGTAGERPVTDAAYREMENANLSRDVLEPMAARHPSALAVLRVKGVFWSDWGSPARILRGVKQLSRPDPLCEKLQPAFIRT